MVKAGKTGRNYQPRDPVSGVTYTSGIGIWASSRGAEFNLLVFRELGRDDLVDEMRQRIADLTGTTPSAAVWPSFPWQLLARDWKRSRSTVLEPYFDARAKLHGR